MWAIKNKESMKKVKKCIAPFLFILAVLGGIYLTELLLYSSNGFTQNWQAFYALEKNSVEILFVGSSHAYASFDLAVIQDKTGKIPYTLATPSQSVIQSYFNVKEVLHYQRPQVLVLEALSLTPVRPNVCNMEPEDEWENELEEDRDWRKMDNIDGMRMGVTKIQAVLAQFYPQNWIYALAKIQRSHDNWKRTDYLWKNLEFLRTGIHEYDPFRPSGSSMAADTMKLFAETEKSTEPIYIEEESKEYFHKLARLCQKEGITLLLVMSPMYDRYIQAINYDSWQREVEQLAEEENVRYIDCNLAYDEIGLTAQDFEDWYSDIIHLNAQGAKKVSEYIAGEL